MWEHNAPTLVFHSKTNLHAAANNRFVRRKLARCLRDNFHWKDIDAICFYDDFLPYSFFFREIRNGQSGICGGLIFHRQEDSSEAHYAIHT